MRDSEANFVGHEECPSCGSSDNLGRWDDGHAYCFGCKHYEPPSDDAAPARERNPQKMSDLIASQVEALPARGITQETCSRYGYGIGQFAGGRCHAAPYRDRAGRIVAQKIRYKKDGKKTFNFLGDKKSSPLLFGSNLLRADGGKMVIVTEGEIDALSVSQAMGNKWPVVSVPNGAHGASKDLRPWIADLERYDAVVLCFDMDEPGRQAVEACVPLFSPGKVRVTQLPEGYKDANDLLRDRKTSVLVDAVWNSTTYRPDGIRSVADLRLRALQPVQWGRPWPWLGYTAATYGIRPGLYSWGAGVGSGKSTTMKEIMLCTMRPDLLPDHSSLVDGNGDPIPIPPPRKVGVFLFEEVPFKTLRDLAGMSLGLRLNKPDVVVSDEDILAEIDKLDGLFFPFDTFGAKDWEEVKSQLLYLIQVEGVLDLWIDPLTALVAMAEDERRELDAVMADLSGIATTHGATIHLVSHLTTPQGTAHEEGGRVMEKHFTGSRAIARWSHNMIGLERDKQKDLPTLLRGLKDREYGEAVGPLIALHFDSVTGRMVEVPLSTLDEAEGVSPSFKDETNDDF